MKAKVTSTQVQISTRELNRRLSNAYAQGFHACGQQQIKLNTKSERPA